MNESKGTRYRRRRRRVRAAETGAAVAAWLVLALTPGSALLADWAEHLAQGVPVLPAEVVSVCLFVFVAVAMIEVVRLPFRVTLARLERRYEVGRPDALGLVVRGAFNAAAAALVLCWGLVATVRLAMWTVGTYWWVATAALAVGVLAVAVHSAPRLLARLSGARPVSKPALRARLVSLADRAGVSVSGVDELPVVQEDRTTAFVGGGGRFRRVFVASTLVRDWSGDEVAVVVAHECGHHVRHDLWRTWALNSVTLVAAFGLSDAVVRAVGGTVGLTGVDHLAALPLLAIVGGSVWAVASPVRHAQSRRHERLADDFALEVTGDADAFAAVIRRLGERHLVEERPPLLVQWLSFRHPSIRDRLAVAQRYRRGQLVSPRRCDGV